MKKIILTSIFVLFPAILALAACQAAGEPAGAPLTPEITSPAGLKVLALESFLADIAQNVAGDRLKIEALIPAGVDPHAFEPTPQDVAKIADSQVLIANGRGLEEWLEPILDNAGGQRQMIEASAGLASRAAGEGEEAVSAAAENADQEHHDEGDPHFWLDPDLVIHYVENIRLGLAQTDPQGSDSYAQSAEAYTARLVELDGWIRQQVEQIPPERRLIITNHESLGYFAGRYGFEIIGTIIPSVSTGSSPSAQQLAGLVDQIKATGAPAIFLETSDNPQLADQIARETGVKVVSGLYLESLSGPGGEAPTYIDMMEWNTQAIVDALK